MAGPLKKIISCGFPKQYVNYIDFYFWRKKFKVKFIRSDQDPGYFQCRIRFYLDCRIRIRFYLEGRIVVVFCMYSHWLLPSYAFWNCRPVFCLKKFVELIQFFVSDIKTIRPDNNYRYKLYEYQYLKKGIVGKKRRKLFFSGIFIMWGGGETQNSLGDKPCPPPIPKQFLDPSPTRYFNTPLNGILILLRVPKFTTNLHCICLSKICWYT